MLAQQLVVVIPARNEERTVGSVVRGARQAASTVAEHTVIIVVADRCWDATAATARAYGAVVVETDQLVRGLGDVYSIGMHSALTFGPDLIAHIDGDGQYSPEDLTPLCRLVLGGADLAVGNRLHSRPDFMSRRRYVLNKVASAILSVAIGARLADSQSGLRAFRPDVARLRCAVPHTYTQAQLVHAVRAGYTVAFSPILFHRRQFGASRVASSAVRYAGRVLPSLIRALVAVDPSQIQRPPKASCRPRSLRLHPGSSGARSLDARRSRLATPPNV